MSFAERLAQFRKKKNLTQHDIAAKIGVGIAQVRRYEKGSSSPTLEVIKSMAQTLGVSADELIFDDSEQVAINRILDRELLEQFELISRLPPHDVDAVKTILESMIIKSRLEEVLPQTKKDTVWETEMRKTLAKFRERAKDYSEEEIEDIVNEAVQAVRAEEPKRTANVDA